MSSLSAQTGPVRIRAPRPGAAAFERARLALVPPRRSTAPRTPFAVLVFVILAAGVVGLLMFNTHMQQASFHATALQKQADALEARRQALEMELDGMRDPQAVAAAAKGIGMVVPPTPLFLRLGGGDGGGSITGSGGPTDSGDGMRIRGNKAYNPFKPKPLVVKVAAPPAGSTVDDGPASAGSAAADGTHDGQQSVQGDPR